MSITMGTSLIAKTQMTRTEASAVGIGIAVIVVEG
jgi:hypothetical protein